jgi:hypothetical protein
MCPRTVPRATADATIENGSAMVPPGCPLGPYSLVTFDRCSARFACLFKLDGFRIFAPNYTEPPMKTFLVMIRSRKLSQDKERWDLEKPEGKEVHEGGRGSMGWISRRACI